MTTETVSRQHPETPHQAALLLSLILGLVALASVIGGFIIASDAKHSSLWIAAGIVEAIAWITAAVVIHLLRVIAINTKR